jgi:hypothetical protein
MGADEQARPPVQVNEGIGERAFMEPVHVQVYEVVPVGGEEAAIRRPGASVDLAGHPGGLADL